MDMLAELMVANAAFKVIKTTLGNGRELLDAGKAVSEYFGAEKKIAKQVASGQGDVLAAYQAQQQLKRQEEELKHMLNKQGLMGYHNFLEFKAQYSRDLKESEKVETRKRLARQKALEDNMAIAIKVGLCLIIVMGALLGAGIYIKGYS
jgi:hypothetical protein|tara:strand:- start:643 stop:1089 length:447 start_codon:yes stop_codon:yes gene_type:complete